MFSHLFKYLKQSIMKKILMTIPLLSAVVISYGQNPLPVGDAQLNAGLGLSGYGIPVYVGLDYGASTDFTLGGELSFRSYNDKYNGTGYNHTIFGISGNGNYHFNTVLDMPSDWDFYAGLSLGFYAWTSPSDYPGNHSSSLGLGAQVGGRYYFSRTAGLNLELSAGTATSGGKFGLTFRL
jgi:outer membrane immunogenic protein